MAIQIPNPGTGNGATGDNEFVLWSKVKDNFSDQTNAASKLVGATAGRVPLAEQSAQASFNFYPSGLVIGTDPDAFKTLSTGIHYMGGNANVSKMPYAYNNILTFNGYNSTRLQVYYGYTPEQNNLYYRIKSMATEFPDTSFMIYSTANVTKDSNGFLKGKSPVTRLFSDRLEHQGEDIELQGVEFKRLGVGDYLLKNTTGLSNDGWYIEIPQDANKNPLFAIIYNDDGNGDLSIKTYKRRFDFETVSIVADTDNPVDIPETRWVDLRFNELPQENLDDTQPEEVDLDK